jgi:hypothetical protein
MQYLDLLSDLRLFSSLAHVLKGFEKVKILGHNRQILNTSVFVNIIHPDIDKLDWKPYSTLFGAKEIARSSSLANKPLSCKSRPSFMLDLFWKCRKLKSTRITTPKIRGEGRDLGLWDPSNVENALQAVVCWAGRSLHRGVGDIRCTRVCEGRTRVGGRPWLPTWQVWIIHSSFKYGCQFESVLWVWPKQVTSQQIEVKPIMNSYPSIVCISFRPATQAHSQLEWPWPSRFSPLPTQVLLAKA